ncbi:MAG: FtsX-like permease family protein [Aeromicrobium sp.]|uniref:ABC transporter permease n=1 Tax=Aeromicrobium sp. TaxID=1871063 RepID=UPI0039E4F01E
MAARNALRTMSGLRRLAVAEGRRRPGRIVVTVLTVALGAGTLTTALILGDSAESAINDGAAVEMQNVDIVMRSEIAAARESAQTLLGAASTDITPDQVNAVGQVPQVQSVGTLVRASAVARTGDINRGISIESLASVPTFQWQRWAAGRPPAKSTEIALTQHTLDEMRIGMGDQVQIGHPGVGYANFTVVGIIDTRGSLSRQSSAYGIVTETVARSLAGIEGVNTLLVDVRDGGDVGKAIDGIYAVAPVGWAQSTADLVDNAMSFQGGRVKALGTVVAVLAAVSCLVAAITSATTTAAGLATRRRTWALARCIGAGRGHVAGLVAAEAFVLAAVGALVGVFGGLLASRLALPVVGLIPGLPELQSSSFTVNPSSLIVPVLVAVGLALAGAVVPAVLAARIAPSMALRSMPPGRRRSGALALVAAVVLTALGAVAAFVGAEDASVPVVLAGVAVIVLAAGALLSPLLKVGAGALASVLKSAPVKLGLRDVVQRPRAAAIEGVAVALAVGMIAMSWVALASVQETTSARLSKSPLPDLTIGAPEGSGVIEKSTLKDLRKIDGVAEAVGLEFGVDVTVEGEGERSHVSLATGTVAVDPHELDAVLPDGFPVSELRDDTVYLPTVAFPPFPDGTRVTLSGPDGQVGDLAVQYVKGLELPAVVSSATLSKVTGERETRVIWLALDSGVDRVLVADEITGVAILAGQLPVSGPVITDIKITEALSTARSAAVAILAVAALVAAIGAAVTASLSVADRAREHAMLRAIGLPRTALGRLLASRVLFIAATSALVGLVAGALAGIAASRIIAVGLGLDPKTDPALLPVLVIGAITVLLVRSAALLPMERASYVRPARALARA